MTQWEYKTFRDSIPNGLFQTQMIKHVALQETLNELGRSGWELVSIVPSQKNGWTQEIIAVLKRPMAANAPPQE